MRNLLELAGRAYAFLFPPPFGILNPIHQICLNAKPLTPDLLVWFQWLVLPLIPLFIISYVLLGGPNDKLARESRSIRAALAVAGWAMLTHSFLTRRFTTVRWAIYNNFIGISYWALSLRYLELALLKHPIVDPWMALGRPRWVAAIDLTINLRHLYLGSIGLDTSTGPPNSELPQLKPGETPQAEEHLQHWRRRSRPTTRLGSVLRHFAHCLFIYCFEDALFAWVRAVGPDALAPPGGRGWLPKHGHVVAGLVAETRAVLLPSTLGLVVPSIIVRIVIMAVAPLMIWGMLSGVYHLGAVICIGSGFWEPSSWDTDIFDAPLRATSLRDLWGRRWHQLYRRTFLNCTKVTLKLLRLPTNTFTFYGLIYLYSGLLHALGQISASPAPPFGKVVLFFVLAGLGNALEVLFKRWTGRYVGGPIGWIWTFAWTIATGVLILDAWADPGWTACSFFPDKGFGQLVLPYFVKHGLTLEPLHVAESVATAAATATQALVETMAPSTTAAVQAVAEAAAQTTSIAEAVAATTSVAEAAVAMTTVAALAVVETVVAVATTAAA